MPDNTPVVPPQPQQQTPRQQELRLISARIEQTTTHIGPIPHPEILERYDQVIPGAAERILVMAENQSAHRIAIENKLMRSDTRNSTLGVVFAFLIMVMIMGVTYSAIIHNQPATAAIISAIGLSGIVGAFIHGTNSRNKERSERSDRSERNNPSENTPKQ